MNKNIALTFWNCFAGLFLTAWLPQACSAAEFKDVSPEARKIVDKASRKPIDDARP